MVKSILSGFIKVLAVLFLFMIVFISLTVKYVSSNNTPRGKNEEKLLSKANTFKKALIIYQPNKFTKQIAHQIAKGLNDGKYEVTLNYPGEHLSHDISEYSVIVFGTPAYAGKPSKVLTDYMSKIKDFSSAKVVLYSTGMLKNKVELSIMENSLNVKKIYKKVKFITGDKKKNNSIAYNLGKELSKE